MTTQPLSASLLLTALVLATLLCLGSNATAATAWPDAAQLPAQPALPDPLVMFSGEKVATKNQWLDKRRPELKALFQHYMYGALPPKPAKIEFKTDVADKDFLAGKATLKLVTISFGEPQAPRIDLLLVVPNARKKPAPVFLALNFCGNHALHPDPRIPLTRGWLYSSCKGCTNNLATDAARGGQAADWPLEEIIDRGYALASFGTSDVDSDRADVSDGLYAWLAKSRGTPNEPHHRGSIVAWAWGFHRAVDYLVTDRDIDRKRIAVVGHSRNGKTALLAAALDERIALSIPHQAGCGGTAPSRVSPKLAALGATGRPTAETVAVINKSFPHWFNAEFKKFNEQPARIPFDQHCLVALCAPRPVLFSNALEDQWANPSGQFEVLQAAEPVYRLLKAGSLDAQQMPELGRLIDSKLGYYIRAGKHSMTADDWRVFLAFADRHLGNKRSR
ncbi:MAG: acetylxylan esterase [Verrucomicrobia bacterium]|nr:acetylxylan esterase [Verrucomicrobiota bacterium]